MWVTAADLPRLRSWATDKNPFYSRALRPALAEAIDKYDKEFFPGGKPNPRWPDPGSAGWVGLPTEAYAELFAFMSLLDPDPAARAAHAQRARDLLMHVMEEAAKGVDPNRQSPAPFRGAAFSVSNRSSMWGEGFGLTVDWIYQTLSREDKATIRGVFLRWAKENVRGAVTNQEHPQPVGLLNDPRLLANERQLRWTANNYYTGHMRMLTMLSLPFDEADDPPVDPAAPRSELGNTLQSYLDDAIGAWMYQQYAFYEDPAVASAALGVPVEGLGMASGGLPVEGFLYGADRAVLHEPLLALYTAGYRDPAKYGPQIRLIDSVYWDRFVDGYLHSIVPVPVQLGYLGQVYPFATYGDTIRFFSPADHAEVFASIAAYDGRTGNVARLEKARWILTNVMAGGAERLLQRAGNIWGDGNASRAILHFLAFDPAAPAPSDPRPSLPRRFHDKALGRILARTDWTSSATLFDYKCSWLSIDHQHGDCNQFELYRKGEWLTKAMSGYGHDTVLYASDYHNTLAIQNTPAVGGDELPALQWFETATWQRGGQWGLGLNAGDPTVLASFGPSWVFAQGDATKLYNRRHGDPSTYAVDVLHASRSIAWLEPDQAIVYDRATTRTEGRFKRFHLTFVGEPVVEGKRVTVTTSKGQRLFIEALLPAGATLAGSKVEQVKSAAEGEPARFRLVVEDPKRPRDVRFLHTLEGADPGAAASARRLVRSSAGTPFEGAVLGTSAVLFPVDLTAPFTQVTYSLPRGTSRQLITGLAPNGGYDVKTKAAGGSIEVTIAPGSAQRADQAGVLAVGALGSSRR